MADPDLMTAAPTLGLVARHDVPVIIAAGITTAVCVVIHYEVLRLMIAALLRWRVTARVAIVATILGLLLAHLVEIFLYATAHGVLVILFGDEVGGFVGDFDGSVTDYFYYSIAVYTTVGFGDITPEGALRILTGVEALTGLVLITWSASFTFLVMQRFFQGSMHPVKHPEPGATKGGRED